MCAYCRFCRSLSEFADIFNVLLMVKKKLAFLAAEGVRVLSSVFFHRAIPLGCHCCRCSYTYGWGSSQTWILFKIFLHLLKCGVWFARGSFDERRSGKGMTPLYSTTHKGTTEEFVDSPIWRREGFRIKTSINMDLLTQHSVRVTALTGKGPLQDWVCAPAALGLTG